MKKITSVLPANSIEVKKIKNNFSRLQTRDTLTKYIVFEYCLKDDIQTDNHYKDFWGEIKADKFYNHLSALMPKSYDQLLSEFRENAKVIADKMLKYQLGEEHDYVEPVFRFRREENTQSQEHSKEKWEVILDIKNHLFNNTPNKIFLFVADSGIGKTTFLRWLNKYILENFEDKVPICVHSKDLKKTDWKIRLINELKTKRVNLESISNRFFLDSNNENLKGFIKTAEDNENLILLVDGLNESRSEDFDLAVNNNFVNNLKILATREEYVDEFERSCPNIEKIYIAPFSIENISEYLGKDYNKLKSKINENKELFQIPIVLRFAYHIYQSTGKLDFENKFGLYSQIIEEAKNNQGEKPSLKDSVYFNDLIEILPYISFKALKKGIVKRIDEKGKHKYFLAQTCKEYSEINPYLQNVKDVIDAFKVYDSIFGIFTHQEGVFEYYHQSFQEYFAACYLKNMPVDEIKKYLYHPLFKEVLIFLGGCLDSTKIKNLIEFLINDVHEDSRKKKVKELTWQNYETASLLIREACEKEKMIIFFWEKLAAKRVSFKEYLDSEFHCKKIIEIIQNFYRIKISFWNIKDDKESLDLRFLNLLIGWQGNVVQAKQEIATCLQEDFAISDKTIDFIISNFLNCEFKGGDCIIDYFSRQLYDDAGHIKEEAICAIAKLEQSNEYDFKDALHEKIINNLLDADAYIRKSAIRAVIKLKWQNDSNIKSGIKDAIIKNLLDADAYIRKSAIDDIKGLEWQNDSNIKSGIKDAIIKNLLDADAHIRKSAIDGIKDIEWQKDSDLKTEVKVAISNDLFNIDNSICISAMHDALRLKLQNDPDIHGGVKNVIIKNLFDEDKYHRISAIEAVVELKLQNDPDIHGIMQDAIIKNLFDESILYDENINTSQSIINALNQLKWLDNSNFVEALKGAIINIVLKNVYDVSEPVVDFIFVHELQNDPNFKNGLKDAVIKNLYCKDEYSRIIAMSYVLQLKLQNDSDVQDGLKNAVIKNLYAEINLSNRFLLCVYVDIDLQDVSGVDDKLNPTVNEHLSYIFSLEIKIYKLIDFILQDNAEVKEAVIHNLYSKKSNNRHFAIITAIMLKLQSEPDVKKGLKDAIIKNLFCKNGCNSMSAMYALCALKWQNKSCFKEGVKLVTLHLAKTKDTIIINDEINALIKLELQCDSNFRSEFKNSIIKYLIDPKNDISKYAIEAVIELKLQNDSDVRDRLKDAVIQNLFDNSTDDIHKNAIETVIGLKLQNDSYTKNKVIDIVIRKVINHEIVFYGIVLDIINIFNLMSTISDKLCKLINNGEIHDKKIISGVSEFVQNIDFEFDK